MINLNHLVPGMNIVVYKKERHASEIEAGIVVFAKAGYGVLYQWPESVQSEFIKEKDILNGDFTIISPENHELLCKLSTYRKELINGQNFFVDHRACSALDAVKVEEQHYLYHNTLKNIDNIISSIEFKHKFDWNVHQYFVKIHDEVTRNILTSEVSAIYDKTRTPSRGRGFATKDTIFSVIRTFEHTDSGDVYCVVACALPDGAYYICNNVVKRAALTKIELAKVSIEHNKEVGTIRFYEADKEEDGTASQHRFEDASNKKPIGKPKTLTNPELVPYEELDDDIDLEEENEAPLAVKPVKNRKKVKLAVNLTPGLYTFSDLPDEVIQKIKDVTYDKWVVQQGHDLFLMRKELKALKINVHPSIKVNRSTKFLTVGRNQKHHHDVYGLPIVDEFGTPYFYVFKNVISDFDSAYTSVKSSKSFRGLTTFDSYHYEALDKSYIVIAKTSDANYGLLYSSATPFDGNTVEVTRFAPSNTVKKEKKTSR